MKIIDYNLPKFLKLNSFVRCIGRFTQLRLSSGCFIILLK